MVWFYHLHHLLQYILWKTFNPTMVWFYRKSNVAINKARRNFQSHYGLILSSKNLGDWDFEADFQSHYGLILSPVVRDLEKSAYRTFNPTMVWFYLVLDQRNRARTCAFNPTMVWFYLKNKQRALRKTCYFQSHYGLILSRNHCVFLPLKHNDFQSHYGLILSQYFAPSLLVRKVALSIPLWSDFIGTTRLRPS